jgi:hypothetical protein
MIGIQLIIAALLFGLVCVGASFYSQKCVQWFLHNDTEDLGYILDTRCVPGRWCHKRAEAIARMKARGADEGRLERARSRANRRYLKRMNRVIAFAKGAPVFENESARKATVDDLAAIRAEWVRREYLHEPY